MDFSGSRRIAAPLADVEAVLRDGRRLAQAVDDWALDDQPGMVLLVTGGPVHGAYRVVVSASELETAVTQLTCDGHGENSSFHGNGRVHLEAQNQQTIIHYTGNIDVTGQLVNLPPRLLRANINAIIRRTLDGIEVILQPQMQSSQPEAPLPQPWAKTAVPAIFLFVAALFLIWFLNKRKC